MKNKQIDEQKISTLTAAQRSDMVHYIVRNRKPVLKALIPDGFDMSWLRCMGYLHTSTNKAGFTCVHTQEQGFHYAVGMDRRDPCKVQNNTSPATPMTPSGQYCLFSEGGGT